MNLFGLSFILYFFKLSYGSSFIDHCLKKKNKKVIEFMKVELDEQIIKEVVRLITKTYSCLKDKNDENRKANGTEKCIIKRKKTGGL